MNRDYLIEMMLANTDFTLDEIEAMKTWEMLSCLGLD